MISAKFMKAFPTEEGITYTLKGEKSKEILRIVADLQDEICIIELAEKKVMEQIDLTTQTLFNLILDYGNKKYLEGVNDSSQKIEGLLKEEEGK